ncbi:hypothetical protein BH09VER1_BH09VER1_48950 [soil metagenome]
MKVSFDRLVGVVVGVFLIRFLDCLFSALGSLSFPKLDWDARLTLAMPGVVGAVLAGLAVVGYVFLADRRWLHVVVLCGLSISGLVAWLRVAAALYGEMARRGMDSRFAEWSGVHDLVVVVVLWGLVYAVLRRVKKPAPMEGLSA